jgi:hypothetical protein
VWHKSFGGGVVVGPRGSGHNASALVRFDDQRAPRTIIARHLRTVSPEGGPVEE